MPKGVPRFHLGQMSVGPEASLPVISANYHSLKRVAHPSSALSFIRFQKRATGIRPA